MIKTVAIVVVLVLVAGIGALLAYAATRPDSFEVRRSTSIKAPPERIFAFIDDFRAWGAWSPYEKIDPAMKRTFSGAARGKGSVYEFEGNSKVGAGRLEMTDVSSPSRVRLTLDMIRPLEGHNIIELALVPDGDATHVTWAMRGSSPFIAKVLGTLFDMDKMIGGQFEQGLANLKKVAESRA